MEAQKLKLRNYISYGIGDIYGGGAFTIIGTFFLIFLTNNVGLSPFLAGALFGIGRFWMSLTDPIFGIISDRTRSRFGRRRIYFLVGLIPILITFIPLWLVPMKVGVNGVEQWHAFVYYFGMYIIFDLAYSMVIIPYSALVADMSHEYKSRVKLSAFRMGFSQFSSILATIVAPILLVAFSYSNKAYLIMAICFSVLYTVIWVVVFFGTFEILVPQEKPLQKASVSKVLGDMFRDIGTAFMNKSFRAQLGLFLFAFAALDILMGLGAYYINDYLKRPDLLSYMSAMWIAQVCVLPFYTYLANKYSKATAYRIGATIWALAMLLLFTLTPHNTSALNVAIHFALIGVGLSPCYMIPMAMISFVTEVDCLMTKKRRTGVYAGAMSSARKLSQGLIVLPGIGLLLTIIGYNASLSTQSVTTLIDLKLIFILLPILLITVGFYFSMRFKVNPKNFEIIKAEISRLKSGGKKEHVHPETQMICEKLTGKKYEQLFN
ncbi:MFS transporter [Cysteiniphilum halobium]|uniref:MFS transporter n=1 Tax=Cysteiniphilum halobium TaxID=2219059 RepID=UPI000E64F5B0|nr:MFS transporter [Cysteiniphilum halobium]